MNNVLLKFLTVLIFFGTKISLQECTEIYDESYDYSDCGTIAQPPGSEIIVKLFIDNDTSRQYSDEEMDYRHGSKVWYRCIDKNDLLIGNDMRRCNRGKWVGSVPRCAINYLNQTELASIEILDYEKRVPVSTMYQYLTNRYNNFGAFTPSVNKHPNDCLKWKISEKQYWNFGLNEFVEVNYIRIKLYAENLRLYWLRGQIRVKVSLNNLHGIKCKVSKSNPLNNFDEILMNNKNNKNFLTLEFNCETDMKQIKESKNHTIFVDFNAEKDIKILTLSVCDLRVYYFHKSCGEPDHPISTAVRKSDFSEELVYNCKDNDHILEGNTYIRCGPHGKWLEDFPICVPKSYCKLLTDDTIDSKMNVFYETVISNKMGDDVIPNGKFAELSCNKSENNLNNSTVYQIQGTSRIICRNGEWHGLSLNDKPNCILKDYVLTGSVSISESKRTIRILFGILITCLIIIVCFAAYMFAVRYKKHKKKMEEIKSRMFTDNTYIENTYEDINYDVIAIDQYYDNAIEPNIYIEILDNTEQNEYIKMECKL